MTIFSSLSLPLNLYLTIFSRVVFLREERTSMVHGNNLLLLNIEYWLQVIDSDQSWYSFVKTTRAQISALKDIMHTGRSFDASSSSLNAFQNWYLPRMQVRFITVHGLTPDADVHPCRAIMLQR
jgi:hypothetical protein